ncbi:integrase core domain-containing protein [Modestobacter caceresii]|uniref:integrase core domain-containing protein n=1 Tax=Modestobacter caceresii TaxID=1522368 RepID=UPI0005699D22
MTGCWSGPTSARHRLDLGCAAGEPPEVRVLAKHCQPDMTARGRSEHRGNPYVYAAAESLIGPYKTELIRRRCPWKGLDDVDLATLEYVDWFNHRRLHGACGDIPLFRAEPDGRSHPPGG